MSSTTVGLRMLRKNKMVIFENLHTETDPQRNVNFNLEGELRAYRLFVEVPEGFRVRGVNVIPVDVVQKSGLTKKARNVKISTRRSARNPNRDVMIKFAL